MNHRTTQRLFYPIIAALCLLISQPFAQETLDFNQNTLGEITTAPITYTFTGTANQQITLEVLSVTDGFLSTYLLIDPSNSVIAQGQANSNSLRASLTLPANGLYLLIIGGVESQSGSYVLRLSTSDSANDPSPPDPVLPQQGTCELTPTGTIRIAARTEPATAAPVAQLISPSNSYTVEGRNDDSSWYQISEGWVDVDAIQLTGDCASVPVVTTTFSALPIATSRPTQVPTEIPQIRSDICQGLSAEYLLATQEACQGVGRNQICYGNRTIETVPNLNNFRNSGDITNLTDLVSLSMSPFANNGADWGVALLQIQANLPDTLPGQNVTILAFGDVSLEANPVANASAPMQSFYFTGGIGESQCRNTPTDGIYIESPENAGIVELIINEVGLQIASKVFVEINRETTQPRLEFSTLEGRVVLESDGVERVIPAGQKVSIPSNDEGIPIRQPDFPEPIDPASIPAAVQVIADGNGIINPQATQLPSQPTLPTTGVCVLATLEPVVVNVRAEPSTDASVVAQIQPIDVLAVVGRNSDSSWYQTELGWIAGFVTRRGGDCSNLPVTNVPVPTSPPISQYPIAGAPINLTVDVQTVGVQHVFGSIMSAYPQGIQSITVNTTILNRNANTRQVNLQISCNGSGAANTSLLMDSGQIFECTDKFLGVSEQSDFFTFTFIMDENAAADATANWQITMEVLP